MLNLSHLAETGRCEQLRHELGQIRKIQHLTPSRVIFAKIPKLIWTCANSLNSVTASINMTWRCSPEIIRNLHGNAKKTDSFSQADANSTLRCACGDWLVLPSKCVGLGSVNRYE